MSVPEGLRGTGKLKIIEDARFLSKYTITITANQKVFLPEYQRSLTDDINRIALAIFTEAFSANEIKVKCADDYKERRRLQDSAYNNCTELLALVHLAQAVFHLKLKRVQYWGNVIVNVKNLLKAWKESDYRRYYKM